MSQNKPGEDRWHGKRLYHRWQLLRRSAEYREATKSLKFDADGMLDYEHYRHSRKHNPGFENLRVLERRFGLEELYSPDIDLPEEAFLGWPIFAGVSAVRIVYTRDPVTKEEMENKFPYSGILTQSRPTEDDEEDDESWAKNERTDEGWSEPIMICSLHKDGLLHLEVDVTATDEQLRAEFMQAVERARFDRKHEKRKGRGVSLPNEDDYRIADMLEEGQSRKAIIETLWREEYKEVLTYPEQDDQFRVLQGKYGVEGIPNWEERAWEDAYGSHDRDDNRMRALFKRIEDSQNRLAYWKTLWSIA